MTILPDCDVRAHAHVGLMTIDAAHDTVVADHQRQRRYLSKTSKEDERAGRIHPHRSDFSKQCLDISDRYHPELSSGLIL